MKDKLDKLWNTSWAPPLLIFLLSRIYTAIFFIWSARYFTVDYSGRAQVDRPDYWTAAMSGDASWYGSISTEGYPSKLALYGDGYLDKSEWAFYPLWPMVCRVLMSLTHLPFYLVSSVLSLTLAGFASILLHHLLTSLGLSKHRSLALASLLFFSPMGLVFSAGLSESLALLLLIGLLTLIHREKYGWAILPILLLGLTRPITLGVAFALVAYSVGKCLGAKSKEEALDRAETLKLSGLTLVSLMSFAIWPLFLAWKFSRLDAYTYVQSAWRKHYSSNIVAWLATSAEQNPALTLILVVGLVSALVSIFAWGRSGFTWPPLLRAWALGYLVFLVLTVPAATASSDGLASGTTFYPSTLRYYLLALIPLVPLPTFVKSRTSKLLVGTFIAVSLILATALYARYFLVIEPPTVHYWL